MWNHSPLCRRLCWILKWKSERDWNQCPVRPSTSLKFINQTKLAWSVQMINSSSDVRQFLKVTVTNCTPARSSRLVMQHLRDVCDRLLLAQAMTRSALSWIWLRTARITNRLASVSTIYLPWYLGYDNTGELVRSNLSCSTDSFHCSAQKYFASFSVSLVSGCATEVWDQLSVVWCKTKKWADISDSFGG